MLVAWEWFGVESETTLRVVLAIAMVLACTMFFVSLAAGPLQRLWSHRATARLVTERDYFFVAFAIALAWYVAFAFFGRVTADPKHAMAMPLSLPIAVACALLTVGVLVLLIRDFVYGRQAFARIRPATHIALTTLLVVGLALG
jgi:hypothetical protein